MTPSIESRDLGPIIGGVVVVLMGLGTVMVFSAGANLTGDLDLEHFYDFTILRQLIFFPLAIAVMYFFSTVDYHRLSFSRAGVKSSLTTWLVILTIFFLVIVLIPGIGISKNNARRWLALPLGIINLSFQPSELAKWVVIFFIAACVDLFGESMRLFKNRFVPICGIIGVMVALILKEDFGTAAFICLMTFILLFLGGAKWWHLLSPLPFAIAGGAAVILSSPARMARISAFLNPDAHADKAAYQATQSLIAISTGGIWGKGLGHGICKYGHLPEDTTDFIFAIVGEELGLVGAVLLILLFIMFVFLGTLVILRSKDRFGQMLASGIVAAVGIQAAVNLGVATVVLPTKGIGLPFVSAGGTSMLLSAAAVGVLLNVAKQLDEPVSVSKPNPEANRQVLKSVPREVPVS